MPNSPTPRACIANLVPYASARRTGPARANVWLNANEGEAWLGDITLNDEALNRYPDFQDPALVDAYAQYSKLDPAQVLATRGADEGIELVIRAFCEAGRDTILIAPPTYGMYAISAETAGVKVTTLERQLGEAIDPSAMVAKAKDVSAKAIFLCTPNNPSGETIPPSDVRAIAEALPESVIVVDEAYIEFAGDEASALSLIGSLPNMVILRTLSKAFGLAGIRVGFSLAQPALISTLSKALAPYPIPRPSAEIALLALSQEGIAKMRSRVSAANRRKAELSGLLNESAEVVRVLPSKANFLTFEAHQPDAWLAAARGYQIAIRDFSRRAGMRAILRVSIGSADECAAFAELVREGVSDA